VPRASSSTNRSSEPAVLAACPDGEAVAQLADAGGGLASEQELGIRIADQAPHAGLEGGVVRLFPLPPVAEADHQPSHVGGVIGCREANH
jgi:hypothetical protein